MFTADGIVMTMPMHVSHTLAWRWSQRSSCILQRACAGRSSAFPFKFFKDLHEGSGAHSFFLRESFTHR